MTLRKRKIFCGLLIFIVCFGWILLLTQGLPVGDPDDWDHILAAQDLPWKTLVTNLWRPWCTSQLWIGQIDRLNEVTHRRLLLSIILKLIHEFSGLHFWPYYIFSKAIFFAGTVTLLFFLALRLTQSIYFALVSVFFFVMVPAHYSHVLWLSVPDTMIHWFMVLGISIYLSIFSNIKNNGNFVRFSLMLLSLLLLGWIAMKTKEPALLLPLSLGVCTLFCLKDLGNRKVNFFLLLAVLGFLVFLIIPIDGIKAKIAPPSAFHLETIFRMYFRNYKGGYEDETVTAFFSLKHTWPVSIARTIGFFSLWSLVLVAVLYLIAKLRVKTLPQKSDKPLIIILLAWLLLETGFMGFFQPDARYFSGIMIPITLLGSYFTQRTGQLWPGSVRRWLFFFIALSIFYHGFINFQHTVYLRTLIGQRSNRFLNVAKSIYQDQFPDRPLIPEEIAPYYSAQYIQKPETRSRIGNVTYYVELDYGSWNQTNNPSLAEFETYAQKGFPYYVTYSPNELKGHDRIKLIQTISGVNENSFLERLLYQLKRKNPQPLFVYKYT